jgi:hypothetical protein
MFGLPADASQGRPLVRTLADPSIDYGPVDLVLHLPVGFLRDFSDASHVLLPSARAGWESLVRGRTPALVLDHAHEGPAFNEAFARRIHRLLGETGLPPRAVWLAQTNRRYARHLRNSVHPSRRVKAIGHIDSHGYAAAFASRAERHGLAGLGRANLDARAGARRVFLCLNAAPRAHRAALAHRLAGHPHRDRVFLTFQREAGPKIGLDAAAPRAAELLAESGAPADDLAGTLAAHAFDVDTSPDNVFGTRDLSVPPELYRGTQLSLVTETDFSDGAVVRYTEKALKPLVMGHPLVVLGNPATLPLLEDLGFDVLRDVIPASYDAIADPGRRFAALMSLVDGLLAAPPAWPWPPEVRERLLANLALFDGPLLQTLRRREKASIEAAARRMSPAAAADEGEGD